MMLMAYLSCMLAEKVRGSQPSMPLQHCRLSPRFFCFFMLVWMHWI
ncbi:Sodium/hydrogen exchanger 2 [Zea mays]|uniref:Sodium/hydrogen exchanger 2 n=1 Tax=Zea mays TaxID=4577 RepID=A0A1D6J4H4_MAIZE|nr:Sodium/hydrogen exchanger 2 [Zea mays]